MSYPHRMKYSSLLFFMLLSLPQLLLAQMETFDIVTYQPPKGWEKKTEAYAVSFTTVDAATGTWCQLGVYKSVASSGDAAKDFASEWKALVKSSTYAGSVEPVPEMRTEGGWTINAGGSSFKWEGKDAQLIVLVVSGYGTMVSMMASMNSDKYMTEVENTGAAITASDAIITAGDTIIFDGAGSDRGDGSDGCKRY